MARLQYYRHNYGLVCMTGLLGCRWHRYKQSTRENRKRDVSWFIVLVLTFLLTSIMFYFHLVAHNYRYAFDRVFFEMTGLYIHWYTLFLAVMCVQFSYLVILLLLSMCHVVRGHQLYIHPVHIVLILFTLTFIISTCVSSVIMWPDQWALLYLSLKIIGPFLWLGTVCLMTALTWVISRQWYKMTHLGWKMMCFCFYLAVIIALYIAPLFMDSPCIIEKKNLPDRPKLFGHRGAMGYAPENTVISFKRASPYVIGFETDVKISLDGVLFLLHDETLLRTTNAQSLFPGLDSYQPSSFNISQIQMLNAGAWYLEHDPNYNIGDVSDADAVVYRNQTVPTFREFLELAILYDKDVMFDIFLPDESHPYFNTTEQKVVDDIEKSGISHEKIWWLNDTDSSFIPRDYRFTYKGVDSVENLKENNISAVNMGPEDVSVKYLETYRQHNVTTNAYVVNSDWFYSLYWCAGTDYVATDVCQDMAAIESPLWHLSPGSFLTLWLSMDILSAVLVMTIFIVQRIRLYGTKFSPEQISLSAANSSASWSGYRGRHSRRSLKEKLLLQDISSDMFDVTREHESEMGIESNGYESTVSVTDGRMLANQYHSNRERLKTEADVR